MYNRFFFSIEDFMDNLLGYKIFINADYKSGERIGKVFFRFLREKIC